MGKGVLVLDDVVRRQHRGERAGITSVCSAHPVVLAAAMRQAAADGAHLLVEATSNQVDQFGGYTGLTPSAFLSEVGAIAEREGFPADRLLFGGDHLGPNRWRNEPAETAMPKAVDLVTAYAGAGYEKLHLDCSMPLAGDPLPLPDALVAARAARLLAAAEAAIAGTNGEIRYVIGTEVPVPGGAHETLGALRATEPDAARATLAAHRAAFEAVGHGAAWPKVMALVVQPAVEFDHEKVVDYEPAGTERLRRVLDDEPTMVFEAHSTDYQRPEALAELVADHWAVLKVGPGLTFALREALFALAAIEDRLVPQGQRSELVAVVDRVMVDEPAEWAAYHPGTPDEQRVARAFSYSDRIRYYWPKPAVQRAVDRLFATLTGTGVPLPLLSQHLPGQYARVRNGELRPEPRELVIDRVRDALRPYSAATLAAQNGDDG